MDDNDKQLAEMYRLRGDALQALVELIEPRLKELLKVLETTKASIDAQDKQFGLTQGKGGMAELAASARRKFPERFGDMSDDEIIRAFVNMRGEDSGSTKQ